MYPNSKSYSTTDIIFIIFKMYINYAHYLELKKKERKKYYAYVDFERTFDKV